MSHRDPLGYHSHALPLQALPNKHNTAYCDCKQCSSVSTKREAKQPQKWPFWVKSIKQKAIGAFNVCWKCLQLDQSWQSRMNPCHDHESLRPSPSATHCLREREQTWNNLLLMTARAKVSIKTRHLLTLYHFTVDEKSRPPELASFPCNAHYGPLRDSYAWYVILKKSATPRNSRTCGFRCTF